MLRHKNKFTKALSLILALIFIVSAFTGCGGDKDTDESTTKAPEKADITENNKPIIGAEAKNPLTGEAGYDAALVNNKPVFVVVENTKEARPQWGLTSSDMVFEMVAEGGIARMLLVYSDISRLPDKIGPVRSSRPYFIDITRGFGGAFIHFGGSAMAYDILNSISIARMDGTVNDGTFFKRDTSRNVDSWHTAYTSKEMATTYFANNNIDLTLADDYKNILSFNDEAVELADGECKEFTYAISSSYKYTCTFNEDEGVYYTALNGEKFVDSDGNQQSFSNIIILYTDVYVDSSQKAKYGESDRMAIELDSGKGVYVSNGTYQNITWEKGNATDTFKFFTEDGEELKLNQGKTYVGITDDSNASKTVIA